MIDFGNKAVFKLKQSDGYAEKVRLLLLEDEEVVDSYQSFRDGIVFTDKRIIVLNVQGITGRKRDYTSIPYANVQVYSIESAGTLDLDAELDLYISGLGRIRFEFEANSKIVEISKHISRGIL